MFNSLSSLLLRKKVLLVLAILFFTTASVFGAVVEMTSGKIVRGEIVERNDDFIRIDTGFGIPVTYYLDEIETIDGESVALVEEEKIEEVEVPEVAETPKAVGTSKSTEKTELSQTAGKIETKEDPAKTPTPAKEIATLEGIDVFKEQASPAEVKPKEASLQAMAVEPSQRVEQWIMTQVDRNTGESKLYPVKTKPKEGFFKVLIQKANKYIQLQIVGYKETGAYIHSKLPFIKEKLYVIPVKIRRDALVFLILFLTILYICVCFPLTRIAKKLGRKRSWLVWIPLVQIVYFIYMAKQPLWLAIFFFVPVLNALLPLLLFYDILKLLKRPRWLIILIALPGVNVFTLWYLAISKTNQSA